MLFKEGMHKSTIYERRIIFLISRLLLRSECIVHRADHVKTSLYPHDSNTLCEALCTDCEKQHSLDVSMNDIQAMAVS